VNLKITHKNGMLQSIIAYNMATTVAKLSQLEEIAFPVYIFGKSMMHFQVSV